MMASFFSGLPTTCHASELSRWQDELLSRQRADMHDGLHFRLTACMVDGSMSGQHASRLSCWFAGLLESRHAGQ
jgi:hypothetical protein